MTFDHNFDNVKEAMNTLYVISSLEGWPDIMLQALDTTGKELGPTKENNVSLHYHLSPGTHRHIYSFLRI